MKTKLLLSAILVAMSMHQALANHANAILNLRMFDGTPIVVKIDGRTYGPLSNSHEIVNLLPGSHMINVLSTAHYHHGFMPVKWITVYSGVINITPGYHIEAVIGKHHNLRIVNMTALYVPPVNPYGYGYHGNYGGGYGNAASGWGNPVVATCGLDTYGYVPAHESIAYMHPADFQDFKRSISSRTFESTKEQIAKQGIARNYFTSTQIAELLYLFTFENTRLEIARFAYDRVVDPDRYYLTYDAFTFESSIRDLSGYTAHR